MAAIHSLKDILYHFPHAAALIPILIDVTRRPQFLSSTPMLLAVTPLPRPLTTPPVTSTYFMASKCAIRAIPGKVTPLYQRALLLDRMQKNGALFGRLFQRAGSQVQRVQAYMMEVLVGIKQLRGGVGRVGRGF